MVPDIVGLALCGVTVNMFPETQYAYRTSPPSFEIVATLPAVV